MFIFIARIYDAIFYRPILNILIFLYKTAAFYDLGLAIIFCTILIRLLLYPFFHQSAKQQMLIQRIQPKLKKIQEAHKDNLEKRSQAMLELYREHQINPFSGFLLLLIQIPILIALYHIFLRPLTPDIFQNLYPFVSPPAYFTHSFLGLINLQKSSILMVGLAAIAQYFQIKTSLLKTNGEQPTPQEKMAKQMSFIGPLLTILIFIKLPAAVSLYWTATSIFSLVQQIIISRRLREIKT